ncbi:SWI/SNF-related matrix-associated actin-dependent regulator of chromatin subfamily A protein [Acrasis kona]|uniref:SWI/SNF-related matrix-associated actin-dependent regulator of chromatin subfamily A protein n=1 Tax=Acrasis kona TaxID=1008807 RepID=A0AAW2Z316_9EUKA
MSEVKQHIFQNITDEDWVAVAVHGGGGISFHRSHPAVKMFESISNFKVVYSVELPNHGRRGKSSKWFDVDEALRNVKEELQNKIAGKRVVFISYSVGGVLISKLWWTFKKTIDPKSICILTGCGLRLELHRKAVEDFWTVEYTLKNNKSMMEKAHGGDWELTIKSVNPWLARGASSWMTSGELQQLNAPESKMYFVIGTDPEEPFDISDITFALDKFSCSDKVYTIPSDHWSYFNKKWDFVQSAYLAILKKSCNLEPGPKLTQSKL